MISKFKVTSPGGNETRSARLSVIELPFAPTNIKSERLDTVTQRAINVSWTPGFDGNSPILKFIVQRREVPELGMLKLHNCLLSFNVLNDFIESFIGPIPDPLLNWVTELSNVSADQRWVLLTSLKAASVYQFRVSAVNSVGEGSPSEPSNVIKLPQEGTTFFFRFDFDFTTSFTFTSTQWTSSWFRRFSSIIIGNYHTMATSNGRT